MRRLFSSLAPILFAALLFAAELGAQTDARELFFKLPDSEANGLSPSQREELWDRRGQALGYAAPTRDGFWVESRVPEVLTLFGVHHIPAVFKLFRGEGGSSVLAVCRGLQTSGPATADERSEGGPPFDLTFFRTGTGQDLVRTETDDLLPPVGVLDFTTRDTMEDYYARKDLELINRRFRRCLTCHASVEDPVALDILTLTSISGSSCASFITHFKLLPLVWNGEVFEKPYDRAADPDELWLKREEPRRGIYYHDPTPSPSAP
ncbi:MAG: hypothetical protein LBR53_09780 [Deltaproteobacteria bacterium]|jgi:hypothetical protein|nr:hypothetical protein [Deltaproteobacteria bacterium]